MTDKKKDRPFVFVRCMTFNHEAYIKDALNGFAIQQTNFPFIVGIIDDASTDNTTSVINEFVKKNCIFSPETEVRKEEYGTVLDVTHKDNPHCIFHIVYLKENHFGKKSKLPYFIEYENAAKYVAMCEGDDYWTDPLKLQKQVDYMETNEDCSLCFHKINTLIQETGELKDEFIVKDMPGKSDILELAKGNYIHTPSVLYRKECLDLSLLQRIMPCLPGDYVIWMLLAEKGYIYKLEEPMAVYRYGVGIWSGKVSTANNLSVLKTLTKLSCMIDNSDARTILKAEVQKFSSDMVDCISKVEQQYNQISISHAYRLGKILLKPISFVRKLFAKS